MKPSVLVENWLKGEGFRCKRDGDGWLEFKYQGVALFCADDDDDDQLLRIVNAAIYTVDGDRVKVLEAINTICGEIKCVKAYLVDDSLWLSLEQFIDSTPDIDDFIERCLDIMIFARQKAAEVIFG